MDAEDLSPPSQLLQDRGSHKPLVKARDIGADRLPVCGWGLDHAQFTQAHQRHIERTGDWRGREGQHIDQIAQLLDLLLMRDSETMLLVAPPDAEVLDHV